MNQFKKNLPTIITFIIIFLLFKYNYLIKISVIEGVSLWFTKVFPSLFIMFILNDIIINLDLLKQLNIIINPLFNKIFKTNGNSSNVFLLSLLSGTPSSAYIVKEMLHNENISINDANKLITFTFFTNPLFLYNILSITFNRYIVMRIIIIHYISNLFIGLFFRNKFNTDNKEKINFKNNNQNFFLLLPNSIKKSLNTLLMILGTIIFYMIITNIIKNIIPFDKLFFTILSGFLEITQSLNNLSGLTNYPLIKEIIAISIISFGGLSIHTQVLSIISDTEIKYKYFLQGRLLHLLLSVILYLFTYAFL